MELTSHIEKQIEEEAKESGDLWSTKLYGDITISAYQKGATVYALKWQQAEKEKDEQHIEIMQLQDMNKRLADALENAKKYINWIINNDRISVELATLEDYGNYTANTRHIIDEALSEYNQSKGGGRV